MWRFLKTTEIVWQSYLARRKCNLEIMLWSTVVCNGVWQKIYDKKYAWQSIDLKFSISWDCWQTQIWIYFELRGWRDKPSLHQRSLSSLSPREENQRFSCTLLLFDPIKSLVCFVPLLLFLFHTRGECGFVGRFMLICHKLHLYFSKAVCGTVINCCT